MDSFGVSEGAGDTGDNGSPPMSSSSLSFTSDPYKQIGGGGGEELSANVRSAMASSSSSTEM